jgi:hypothetical protein
VKLSVNAAYDVASIGRSVTSLERSPHDVGDVLDDAPDRQRAPARRLAGLLLGEPERGGADGGELLVDVVDQTGDLVVLCGCVHGSSSRAW